MSPARTTSSIEPKPWVQEAQDKIVTFLLTAYGFLLASTMALFFFQGFRLCGFSLDNSILQWLCGVTIGEIGGLLTLAIK